MYATFVVPARHGCNLNCPYCAVVLRNEARETVLTDEQYLWFLKETLTFPKLKKVSIVGYEPTLDESIDLTAAMLTEATLANLDERYIATSMNTNGLNLPKHLERVCDVVDTVMISLDSDKPDINDRMRGMKGTFAGTVAGIECAVSYMGRSQSVVVNTLLVPGKVDRIQGMPKLLKSLGVKTWVISPYIDFREGELRPKVEFIRDAVFRLAREAELAGIVAFYADEFRVIGPITGISVYNFQRPGDPEEFVFRLAPNGTCSVGDEILADSGNARVWDGKQNPREFLKSLM